MATLKELMAKQSPESQERITEKVEILRQAVALNMLREELNLSQAELASAMGLSSQQSQKWSRQITILVCRRSSVMSRHWVVNLALMLSYLQVKESRSIFKNPSNRYSLLNETSC